MSVYVRISKKMNKRKTYIDSYIQETCIQKHWKKLLWVINIHCWVHGCACVIWWVWEASDARVMCDHQDDGYGIVLCCYFHLPRMKPLSIFLTTRIKNRQSLFLKWLQFWNIYIFNFNGFEVLSKIMNSKERGWLNGQNRATKKGR